MTRRLNKLSKICATIAAAPVALAVGVIVTAIAALVLGLMIAVGVVIVIAGYIGLIIACPLVVGYGLTVEAYNRLNEYSSSKETN